MQLNYLNDVLEDLGDDESLDVNGGGIGVAVVAGGIIVVGILGIGKGLYDMATDAYKEQTSGGTLQ